MLSKPGDLASGEVMERRWNAGLPYERFGGRIPRATGALFLTNQRLIFDPIQEEARRPKDSSLRTWGLFAGEKSLGFKAERGAALLDDISGVEEVPGEMPFMRVALKGGTEVRFSFQERMLFNPPGRRRRERNRLIRDDAVRSVAAAVKARH